MAGQCAPPPGSGRCRPAGRPTRGTPMTSQPTPNHAATGDPGPARSRRSFLGRALGASALALPALGLVSTPGPGGGRAPRS